MNYELRKYSFGETLGKGFNLYLDNFIPIVLVSILCEIPSAILLSQNNFNNVVRPEAVFSASFLTSYLLNLGISFIAGVILSAFIIHLVSRKFLQGASTSRDNLSVSFIPFILPVIGLSILLVLIIFFGFLLVIFPGIVLTLGLCFATQVLVIEKRTVFESIKRSWDLTKGKKGELFAILVVSYLMAFLPLGVVVVILTFSGLDTQVLGYLNLLLSALIAPGISCIMVVIYFNLRIEKEGFNIEHLAQQFTLADSAGPSVES